MFFRTTITLALAFAPAPLFAQAVAQPIGVSDADALAEQVRRLGANPLDLDALLTAAELSLRLDDLSAAGSFLARADRIAPGGARGQAIRGAILVRSERPGEALRQFAQAEAMGLAPARFAADRGLAYDLTGDQPRAQREYRLALREGGGDDETRRRYALSLGISGKQREALDELAPLVRRNDRAAWRTRAFVLAMGGDAAEASRIAATMMPPGSAQGLKTFFDELPGLPAVDRAFAVHFGEVRPAPGRLADARLAPPLAPLPAEPAPVQVAAVAVAPPAPVRERGRRKAEKLKPGRVAIAAEPSPAPVQAAVALEVPSQPPAYQPPAYQPPAYQPPVPYRPASPTSVASAMDRPLTPGEQASLAAATLRPEQRRGRRSVARSLATPPLAPSGQRPVTLAATTPPVTALPSLVQAAPGATARATARLSTPPAAPVTQPAPTLTAGPSAGRPASLAATTLPSAAPVAAALGIAPPDAGSAPASPAPVRADPAPGEVAALPPVSSEPPVVAASMSAALPAIATPPVATSTPPAALVTPPRPKVATLVPRPAPIGRAKADDILARIVANLSVPASELGVGRATAGGKPSRVSGPLAAAKPVADKKFPVDRRADARKALADKKAAVEKKALADKEAAEKRAARAEPSRIWVQVAGGANERDLGKAWSAARGKAPDALAGRKGYTARLRATNRVLTGPFKTDAEAQDYVSKLRKNGIGAFSFTSDAGQKVSRLDTK